MGQNPLNLALRFVLELVILIALGYWGWARHEGIVQILLTIGLPLLAAILWGTFRVPGEMAGSPRAPVPTPGWLRLLLEGVLFVFATWALYDAGATTAALIFGAVSLAHYAVSYDRVIWLLRPRAR